MGRISAIEYLNNLYYAYMIYFGKNGIPVLKSGAILQEEYKDNSSLYIGKEGCLRMAREFGYGLKDYPEKERKDALRDSYGTLCARLYNLRPPISAKEWDKEIMSMWE